MFHVVLYHPEIPPNTGNIMRLCANTDTALHLIHPLGFALEDQLLRRAGLDYREWADVTEHETFDRFLATVAPRRLLAFTRNAGQVHAEPDYETGDALLFGPESDGLPAEILDRPEIVDRLRIPMVPRSRSLNLANAVAIVLYEALRQNGFPGLLGEDK
ncbi:MAG: tRNA (cytidine(34)-2'-O)-methyltransferase [Acidimicrobiia bacterium]|nr:tRNA (cytidine(34)-2'-O)-methyltransferase [Acidimicrobiia bacterium]